jgi:RNA-directed DNA polymerase
MRRQPGEEQERPSSTADVRHGVRDKPMAKRGLCREGVRGARSTADGVATTTPEGRSPALTAPMDGGKREGMSVSKRTNNPVDKVRRLQRRLFTSAKESPRRRFHALYDRIWRGNVLA